MGVGSHRTPARKHFGETPAGEQVQPPSDQGRIRVGEQEELDPVAAGILH